MPKNACVNSARKKTVLPESVVSINSKQKLNYCAEKVVDAEEMDDISEEKPISKRKKEDITKLVNSVCKAHGNALGVRINVMEKSEFKKTQETLCQQIRETQTLSELFNVVGNFLAQAQKDKPALILPDPVLDQGKYELWKDRNDKNETSIDFLSRVWGDYINAELMYQTDLRGSRARKGKKGLDENLFAALSYECRLLNKKLNSVLPNKSIQVDRELKQINLSDPKRLASLALSAASRYKK